MRATITFRLLVVLGTVGALHATPTVATTATPSAFTPTPSPLPTAAMCVGDCNGDGVVSINELITGVNIALNGDSDDTCPAFTCDVPGLAIICLIFAVNNALNGCQPTPVPPELSLGVQASLFPEQHQVDVVAALSHLGGSVVSYVFGCTAECYPKFLTAISFDVTDRDGNKVFLSNPCGPPALCPETLEALSPGDSLAQALSVTGTAWKRQQESDEECGTCTQVPLAEGRYVVTARFYYRIGADWADPQFELSATAGFDWPPSSCTAAGCTPSVTATGTSERTPMPPSPTPTGTPTEFVASCCQLPSSCYRPEFPPVCSVSGGEDFQNPYVCNQATGRCEASGLTPTPTATPTP